MNTCQAAYERRCVWCGQPVELSVFEVWPDGRFLIDACCEGAHHGAESVLNDDSEIATRLLRSLDIEALCHDRLRRVIDDGAGGLRLDWKLRVVPVSFSAAAAFVRAHHAHNPRPPAGWKYGAAICNGAQRIGIIMVGRPVARHADPSTTVEVSRLCIDRSVPAPRAWNACSQLLGWAAAEARRRGYARIQTFTLRDESGTSLRAAGWTLEGQSGGGSWSRKARPRVQIAPVAPKLRWSRSLRSRPRQTARLDAKLLD
jgi:hypothetical protein